MPKGRRFVPTGDAVGNWFQHRGYDEYQRDPSRFQDTSTGSMMTSTFSPESKNRPAPPPETYHHKHRRNFKFENDFSYHDNRNTLQHTGEYLGNGRDTRFLGKSIHEPVSRQHFTHLDYLKHKDRSPVDYDYNTSNAVTYQGLPAIEPPRFRRYSKHYREGELGYVQLNTTTTDWHEANVDKYRTPTQVLASSQEPFLKSNAWQYSYNGLSRVYPPYDEIKSKRSNKVVVN